MLHTEQGGQILIKEPHAKISSYCFLRVADVLELPEVGRAQFSEGQMEYLVGRPRHDALGHCKRVFSFFFCNACCIEQGGQILIKEPH